MLKSIVCSLDLFLNKYFLTADIFGLKFTEIN